MLPTHEGCDVVNINESIAYVLCCYLPPPQISSDETIFVHILHIMDQTWDYGDLNDGGPSFAIPWYETMITWGTYYGIQKK
jgi:hypothetical protein